MTPTRSDGEPARWSRCVAVAALGALAAFFAHLVTKGRRRPPPWINSYSSAETRARWVYQLDAESEKRPLTTFGAVGHLIGLAGAFPLADTSPESTLTWLLAHRHMFGLGAEDEITLCETVQSHTSADQETVIGVGIAGAAGSGFSGDGREFPLSGAIVHTFDLLHQGYPYSGMQLVASIRRDRPLLAGVFNTFSPSFRPKELTEFSSERAAWSAAETAFGVAMDRQSAIKTWFDGSWALYRVSGTQELHWRLSGLDPSGAVQYAFVRASDNKVTYHSSLVTSFTVRQTDLDSAQNVLWDSATLPNGCVPGTAWCSNPALAESLRSRDIFPKVVDLWYRMSLPGVPPSVPPFVWPFSGPNKAPFDNQGGRAIRVVVANPPKVGLNIATTPTRDGLTSTYTFPEGTVTRGYVGHEYGHVLLAQLKFVHPGGRNYDQNGPIPAASFTEAMADFLGIVTEHLLTGKIPAEPSAAGWLTDFSIGDFVYDVHGSVIASPPVAWDMRSGNCTGLGRERLGRAFIKTWGADVQRYGDRPHSVGEATYRGWWIDIMRSFALLPDFGFPTIQDFYAATLSRLWTYALPSENGFASALYSEMDKLGLGTQGCY